jgi:hypothetical protein
MKKKSRKMQSTIYLLFSLQSPKHGSNYLVKAVKPNMVFRATSLRGP